MAIDTQRLRLRPVTPADVDSLHELDSDPNVMRFVNGGRPTARDTIAEWVVPRSQTQFRTHGTGMWTARLRRGGDFIGWVQLRLPRHSTVRELELSYRFDQRVWGHGLAAEAAGALIAVTFLSTDTERIFASTHSDHNSSQAVMRKLGMRLSPAGLSARQLSGHDDEHDVEYEILHEQWAAARGRRAVRPPAGRHRRPTSTTGMPA
ncbi:GNAT family N-acetyltransferase [Gordonia zhaorongruii]|uniref:GNAT family N-acetyltransferase n=1 Tax=Gordonia zhaorongruii TaxID=2597659 RepID=UPI001050E031|nr:GNAT family N-acetyltransferase [Gordonia zhaorongruii]